ncbi:MAG: hypothetical protein JSV22_02945, partial [Bacteroidales bacterium]
MSLKMRSTILIEKYLAGTLKGERLRNFERQLKQSSELQELVILHKEINDSIENHEVTGFKNKLNRIYSRFRQTERNDAKEILLGSVQDEKRPVYQRRLVIVAASITLIIIIGALLYLSKDKVYTNNELFSMYHKPYEPDIIIRSDSEIFGKLESAILLYSNGNYNTAFSEFVNIMANDNNNYLAQFYLGLTCMELNKFDVAIEQFTDIPEDWGSPFRYH